VSSPRSRGPDPGPASRRSFGPGVILALVLAVAAGDVVDLRAQAEPASDPLTAFGARLVGTWEGGDSRHVFAWGLGQRVLESTSYIQRGGTWEVVSKGWWYWDPAVGAVRGTTVAVGMGIDLFEYTARVEGEEIVHDLVTHGDLAGRFVERWRFEPDGSAYTWTLLQEGERLMGGSYRRVPAR
jgi:hypothetical protein